MSLATLTDPGPAGDELSWLLSDNFTGYSNGNLTFGFPVARNLSQAGDLSTPDWLTPAGHPVYPSRINVTSRGCGVNFYDVSRYPYPRAVTRMETWEAVTKSTAAAMLTLVAIIGNILIIIIVILSQKMRTTTNCYIVNLAVADLIVACFPNWIYVTTNVASGWILGAVLCKLNAFVQVSAMCTMSFTMMAIAGDRFFAIVFPLKARVTQRKVKVVLVVIWTLGMAIGIPPLLYYQYTERQWANYLEMFCSDVWPSLVRADGSCDAGTTAEQLYWTVVLAALNWVPMLVMTSVYGVIIHRLQFGRVTHNGSDSMSPLQRRSAKRAVLMLFVLLITFMACTIPFQVTTIYGVYKQRTAQLASWYQPVYYCAIFLMYSHSAINPIVYGAMNQTFRSGFRHLVERLKRRTSAKSVYSTNETAVKPNISIVDRSGMDVPLAASRQAFINYSY